MQDQARAPQAPERAAPVEVSVAVVEKAGVAERLVRGTEHQMIEMETDRPSSAALTTSSGPIRARR